jgi:hypothetical protein
MVAQLASVATAQHIRSNFGSRVADRLRQDVDAIVNPENASAISYTTALTLQNLMNQMSIKADIARTQGDEETLKLLANDDGFYNHLRSAVVGSVNAAMSKNPLERVKSKVPTLPEIISSYKNYKASQQNKGPALTPARRQELDKLLK